MSHKVLSPYKVTQDEILVLATTQHVNAWVQRFSIHGGRGKVFVPCPLPSSSTLAFEGTMELWLLDDDDRTKSRVRFYDFAQSAASAWQVREGQEVLQSVTSAIAAGVLRAVYYRPADALAKYREQRPSSLPAPRASAMLARCDLLPASSDVRAEYRSLVPLTAKAA